MTSMTGYGYKEYQDEKIRLILELKAYNNRYLDIVLNIPPHLSPLETVLREFLRNRIARGRVELTVRMKELEEQVTILVDKPVVEKYISALREIAATAGIDETVNLSHLISMEGALKLVKDRDYDRLEALILAQLDEVFFQFQAARTSEGEHTASDIRSNLDAIESGVGFVESRAEDLEEHLTRNLRERFSILLEDQVDENRILAEIAVLLMKYGIGEELSRLKSHVQTFRLDMEKNEPVGKKLDFICQELGREINTIGSKSVLVDINRSVIEMKDALEKIREQLRNVE